jgi:drug/metabolite transporter (DMT)-like permease
MAMDPAIVFVFSVFFLENFEMGWRRNLLQIIAACLAVGGTVFFAIEGNDDLSDNALSDTLIGVLFVCGSVLLSSTYKVAFARCFPSDLGIGQVSWLLGIIGLLNLLLIWPLVLGLSQGRLS